jgi:4-amino-4-deoxy-L-arabinose transferase-like glycosyltransferase
VAVVVAAYVVIGVLYALYTPTWQIPDEPAHYNYVRALAEGRGFPVIEPGDYDQEYLGRLTAERFPPELSIDGVEYGDHHPPLYYLLATPVYLLSGGAVLPLRLFSVLLGAALLVAASGTVRALCPVRPALAPLVAALIAFVPQHVAMMAGVNNDPLAELVVAGTLWALVIYVAGGRDRPWAVGLLLAAALLTKTTVYFLVGVAVVAVLVRRCQERRAWRWALAQLAWMLLPAALLSAPWFVRNALTYGWNDPLGWARHEEVVAGQMRSAEYLSANGWGGLLERLVVFTFQSFWGQFGWMAVVLPARLYWAFALFSLVLLAAFLWWAFDRPRLTPAQRGGGILLLAAFCFTALTFLGYNLGFMQHQGRYLFPALIPLGIAGALGLARLAGLLPRLVRPWAAAAPLAALAAFDVYCLFRFVVPHLSP